MQNVHHEIIEVSAPEQPQFHLTRDSACCYRHGFKSQLIACDAFGDWSRVLTRTGGDHVAN
jgi:hypothetical protein